MSMPKKAKRKLINIADHNYVVGENDIDQGQSN